MITREEVGLILDVAVQAPSGDNAQPWKFQYKDGTLSVFNVAGKDASIYNFAERGSYLAHGALLENIRLVSASHGYDAVIKLFPGEADCTASVTFTASSTREDILTKNIAKRSTNRKPYIKLALDTHEIEMLMATVKDTDVSLHMANREDVRQVAGALALNDRLLFENPALHAFLFSIIRWTREEEHAKPGLYVKTMEFPMPLEMLLKYVLCNFNVVQVLNGVGFSSIVYNQSVSLYATSSTFYAFSIRENTKESYVKAGMALQRFWLTAESLDLSVQPLAGLPYLAQRIAEGSGEAFSAAEQGAIGGAVNDLRRLLQIPEHSFIPFVLRIGHSEASSANSLKLPPIISE